MTLNDDDDDDDTFRFSPNKTKKKMGEKRSSLFNEREFPTSQKNFRVLIKHQYFLGFFGRGDFFLRGWFPTLSMEKKIRS